MERHTNSHCRIQGGGGGWQRQMIVYLPVAMVIIIIAVGALVPSTMALSSNGSIVLTNLRGADDPYCSPGFPYCDNPVLGQQGTYNYVPSLMLDGKYRAWWCAGCEGDCIFSASSNNLDVGWSAPTVVFTGTQGPEWDGQHTCDPSVLRVNGVMYLYYGGFPIGSTGYTQVGCAVSNDNGGSFQRVRTTPIIAPALATSGNNYGAGQPSVVFLDGMFYILYTDTTGRYANGNFAYVMRSPDPFFQSAVEELHGVGGGFHAYSADNHTRFPFLNCASVDWVFSDVLDAFIVGCDGYNSSATRLLFYDRALSQQMGFQDAPGRWTEGPGLLKRADQHSPFLTDTAPGQVPVDILRSFGPGGPNTWTPPAGGLAHSGGNLEEVPPPAASVLHARVIAALEGCAIEAPGMPLAVVVSGLRLQFASFAPVQTFVSNFFIVNTTFFGSIPYGASVQDGAKVLGTPGRPPAFLLDDGKLWPIACLALITANGSEIDEISVEAYDAYPMGPSLYCLTS